MGDILRLVRRGKFIGWYIRFKDMDGRRKTRATHQPTKEAARRYLVEIEARIARGLIGIPEPAARPLTVAELTERFLSEYSRPRIKSMAEYRMHARKYLRMVLPFLGNRPADALSPGDIARARDTLLHKYAPASVRVCLAYFAKVYAWAVKLGLLPGNPVREVERPAATASLEFYSREEINALLFLAEHQASASADPLPKLVAACLQLAVHTGLRKGELLGLRWQDLDLETQRLTVARSYKSTPKSGKTRHLRLPSVCVPILREWRHSCPRGPEGLVFPIARKTLDARTPGLLAAAGCQVPAHPWHALRHSFASHFVMAGGNILTLQKILGHSDIKMTLVYAHLAPDFLGAEMERVQFNPGAWEPARRT